MPDFLVYFMLFLLRFVCIWRFQRFSFTIIGIQLWSDDKVICWVNKVKQFFIGFFHWMKKKHTEWTKGQLLWLPVAFYRHKSTCELKNKNIGSFFFSVYFFHCCTQKHRIFPCEFFLGSQSVYDWLTLSFTLFLSCICFFLSVCT